MITFINNIFLLVVIFLSFCQALPDINDSSFEGKVEYSISYPNQRNKLSDKVTGKFVIYYKHGNIRKEYRNIKDSLLFYSIYLSDTNVNYGFTPGNDTITYYQPSGEMVDNSYTKVEHGGNGNETVEEILGYKCLLYKVEMKYKDAPENEPSMNYLYYVSEKLKAHSKYLKGDGANFVFMPSGSIILKYIIDVPVLKVVTATQVSEEKLRDSLFKIDFRGRVLQEL